MRHGAVSYFDDGAPVDPEAVSLTNEGRAQAEAARDLLDTIVFDRVIASGLPRTIQTARIVSARTAGGSVARAQRDPRRAPLVDSRRRARERVRSRVPRSHAEREAGSSAARRSGSCFDRVIPAVDRLVADESWDTVLLVLHGAVNRAIISHALTGQRMFLGQFEQAPGCVNILDVGDEWIVRAVEREPVGPRTPLHTARRQWSATGSSTARIEGRSQALRTALLPSDFSGLRRRGFALELSTPAAACRR